MAQAKAGASKRGGSKLRPGGSLLQEPGFPGAVPGGEAERSAFWIVMEVREHPEADDMHGARHQQQQQQQAMDACIAPQRVYPPVCLPKPFNQMTAT